MKFCEKCNNIMKVTTVHHEKFLYCKSCGNKEPLVGSMKLNISHEKDEKKVMIVDENAPSEFPVTEIMCPQCGEIREAFWTMQQTRAGDEPPTRFYECKVCGHRWREYS